VEQGRQTDGVQPPAVLRDIDPVIVFPDCGTRGWKALFQQRVVMANAHSTQTGRSASGDAGPRPRELTSGRHRAPSSSGKETLRRRRGA
jgi:hypothetical protein